MFLENKYNDNKLDGDKGLQGKIRHEGARDSGMVCACAHTHARNLKECSEGFKRGNHVCKEARQSHWFSEGERPNIEVKASAFPRDRKEVSEIGAEEARGIINEMRPEWYWGGAIPPQWEWDVEIP